MTARLESAGRHQIFSLYNLSSREIYFEDYIVSYEDNRSQNKTKGRLKVCSKSLVFVPDDGQMSMIKVLYKNIEQFEDAKRNSLSLTDSTIFSDRKKTGHNLNRLILHCSSVTLIYGRNRIEPYNIEHNQRTISFEFQYTSVEDCLSVIGQLYRSTTLSFPEQMMMIESIVQGRLKIFKFDLKQLNDFRENILFENDAYIIKALVQNPGRCLLTDRCCYFQALNNLDEQQRVAYPLSSLHKLSKRRYKFRYIGCELRFRIVERQKRKQRSIYFVFSDEEICSKFYETIRSQSEVQIETNELQTMTIRWQNGLVSNYDYLLFLNDQADRSFQDCSQYPVFPWVLRNYTSETLDLKDPQSYRDLSKPIGALNIERLERLKERFHQMGLSNEQPFLYGSFYSNPGFVVYYLCRLYPEWSLCLNGGRFDHPDRLFHSIIDTWKSVLTSDSDVKELLPEFYMSSKFNENQNEKDDDDEIHRQDGQFLLNENHIDFGVRHDNAPINDVLLPPWAKDPSDFVYQMRMALESEHVSQNLHLWIDLVFGYKQRGEEAEKSDNLFHPLTYGMPKRNPLTSTIQYDEELSLQTQILEFGQVPKQLFDKPHPKRSTEKVQIDNSCENKIEPNSSLTIAEENSFELEFDSFWRVHRSPVRRMCVHPRSPSKNILTIGDDGFLKNYDFDQMKIEAFYSVSSRRLTSFQSISAISPSQNEELISLVFVGTVDGKLSIYQLERGTSIFCDASHEDSIVELYVSRISSPVILCSCSADATVSYWSLENIVTMENDRYVFKEFPSRKTIDRKHSICFDSSCTAMNVIEEHHILAVSCQDKSIYICRFETGQIFKQISLDSSFSSLSFRSDGLILACLSSEQLILIDIFTDALIFQNKPLSNEKSFRSIFFANPLLIIGLADGFSDVWNLSTCQLVSSIKINDRTAINDILRNGERVFFATEDGSIFSYIIQSRKPSNN